jgi:hypothetical protein
MDTDLAGGLITYGMIALAFSWPVLYPERPHGLALVMIMGLVVGIACDTAVLEGGAFGWIGTPICCAIAFELGVRLKRFVGKIRNE